MGRHQNVADLLERFRQELDPSNLQFERRKTRVAGCARSAPTAYLYGAGAEFHPHRVKGDEHGGVFQKKDKVAALAATAAPAITAYRFLFALGAFCFGQLASLAILLALIMLEHADDREGHAID